MLFNKEVRYICCLILRNLLLNMILKEIHYVKYLLIMQQSGQKCIIFPSKEISFGSAPSGSVVTELPPGILLSSESEVLFSGNTTHPLKKQIRNIAVQNSNSFLFIASSSLYFIPKYLCENAFEALSFTESDY